MAGVEVRGLSVAYGGLAAVDDVSFAVATGSIKGIIGPNGAGKTTLFNAMSGVTAATSGSVRFEGRDITALPPHRRAELGLSRTFQNLQLIPTMTVLENVMLGAHPVTKGGWLGALVGFGTDGQRRAEELAHAQLARLGLTARAADLAADLGFVDAKLLEMARALAAAPKLLLLDEPLAGVPLAEQERVSSVIRAINAEGVTVLLVEHNMRVVMRLCDDLLVLDHGKRLAEGDPASIASHPEVIRAYLGHVSHA